MEEVHCGEMMLEEVHHGEMMLEEVRHGAMLHPCCFIWALEKAGVGYGADVDAVAGILLSKLGYSGGKKTPF